MPSLPPTHRSAIQRVVDTTPRAQPSWHTLYDTRRWRRLSKQFLMANPVCACGCARAACVVDHRIPHRGNRELFWDETNWQAMTKSCHDEKTAREDRLTGRPA